MPSQLKETIKFGDVFTWCGRTVVLTKTAKQGFDMYQLVMFSSGNLWNDKLYKNNITRKDFMKLFDGNMEFLCNLSDAETLISFEKFFTKSFIKKTEWSPVKSEMKEEVKEI